MFLLGFIVGAYITGFFLCIPVMIFAFGLGGREDEFIKYVIYSLAWPYGLFRIFFRK